MLAPGTKVKVSNRYPCPGPSAEADRALWSREGTVLRAGNTDKYSEYNAVEYIDGGMGLFLDAELDVIDD